MIRRIQFNDGTFGEVWDQETLQLDVEGWPDHYDGSLDPVKGRCARYVIDSGLSVAFLRTCQQRGLDPKEVMENMMRRYVRAAVELGLVVVS